eukprot:1161865-Pelagomonas_calceolata.AAC.12
MYMRQLGVNTSGAVRASGKSLTVSVHKGGKSLFQLKQRTSGCLWKGNTTNRPLLVSHRALATDQTNSSAMDRATVLDKIRGALWGVLIADSLSMPVHWYYNPQHIVRDFGEITTYQAPKVRRKIAHTSLAFTWLSRRQFLEFWSGREKRKTEIPHTTAGATVQGAKVQNLNIQHQLS